MALLDTFTETRRKGLGASDAAIACGFSPWDQPLGLYLNKLGMTPPKKQTSALKWGHLMEPVIAHAYTLETGTKLVKPQEFKEHPFYHFLFANGDRVAEDGARLVELKNVSSFAAGEWGEPGTDQIPPYYLFQVQQQMDCYEIPLCDVAALIGGNELRIYTVTHSPKFLGKMLPLLKAFWERVLARQPPPPDFARGMTVDLLDALYPASEGSVLELPQPAQCLANNYAAIRDQIKGLEEQRSRIKVELLSMMGTAQRGLVPGGFTILRGTVSRKGYTVEPTTYSTFTVKGPK